MASLQTLPPDCTVAQALAALLQDGAVIIRNLATAEEVARANAELQPWLDRTPKGVGEFVGYETKRCCGLLGKSAAVGEMATKPLIMGLCDEILLPQCTRYRLSVSEVISIFPSETVQNFHRDDALWPFEHPVVHHRVIHSIWALTEFTAENGATRVIPGSHKWPEPRDPAPDEWTQAVMPAGSVLLYFPDTLHSGGANASNAPRTGMILGYIVGWLRQEEEQFLAVPPDIARTLPKHIQELLGYKTHEPYLGWLDQADCALILSTNSPEERVAVDLDDGSGEAGQLVPGKWSVLI